VLTQASIPTYPYPDTAARVFNNLWRYNYNLKVLYETPNMPVPAEDEAELRARVSGMIETARRAGRTVLTELESKQIMEAYGIPSVDTYLANSQEEAVTQAEALGYPVVLKLHSYSIIHKSDVGGVQLNLHNPEQIRKAYQAIQTSVAEKAGPEHFQGVTVQPMIRLDDACELILGSSLDEQFGPVLLFGSGGQLVEVYQDHSLGLPPLNTTLARRMMEQTKVYTALQGVRGRRPVDLAALEQLMVQFSRLVVEQRFIKEIDINPLLASADQLLALDARVILHEASVTRERLPRLAIRPYPNRYVQHWTLRDGNPVTLRPIRPEDEPLMVKFHETLSERSVFFRYLHMLGLTQRTAHDRLTKICFIDYDREMALVADYESPETGQHEILAVGRLIKLHGKNEAEFAILVSDQWQGHGLGIELLRRLLQIGRDEKLDRIVGDIHPENQAMQAICRKLGFKSHYAFEDQVVKVHLDL
jgi:acetyltransferase